MRERPRPLLGGRCRVERRPVRVGPPEVHRARHARLRCPPAGITGERDRSVRGAVVAPVHGHHLVTSGVQPSHADGVLGGLGSAVGEEHHVEVAGREFGDETGRLAAGLVGVKWGDRAQLGRLLLDRGDKLRMLMADVDVDELRREVEVPVAGLVPEPTPVGPGDYERVERTLCRPGVEHVGPVIRVGAASLRFKRRHGCERNRVAALTLRAPSRPRPRPH